VRDETLRKRTVVEAISQFIRGATVRMPALVPIKEMAGMELLFFLTVFGDYLGIPTGRPYYSLRFLLYMVPRVRPWTRSLLRERDLTDKMFS
jgi:hypothetical protein